MLFQGSEGIVELAVVAAFVAAEQIAVAVSVAYREECAERLARRIFFGVRRALTTRLVGEAGGFERPDAEEAPVGHSHFFDEDLLDVVGGFVFGGEGVEESGEAGAGFVGEENGIEEEGLAAGVTAAGFGGVGAVGGEFAVGEWHTRRIIREGCKGKYVKLLILLEKSVEQVFWRSVESFFYGPQMNADKRR